jgi:hypothetical protein
VVEELVDQLAGAADAAKACVDLVRGPQASSAAVLVR